jgi:hypothetical protein
MADVNPATDDSTCIHNRPVGFCAYPECAVDDDEDIDEDREHWASDDYVTEGDIEAMQRAADVDPAKPIAWTSEDGIHNLRRQRSEGKSHWSLQVRTDRRDDYNTVPLYTRPTADVDPATDDLLARTFHENYERLAPNYGYKTREASAVPWEDVPEQNKALMRATVAASFADLAAELRAAETERDAAPATDDLLAQAAKLVDYLRKILRAPVSADTVEALAARVRAAETERDAARAMCAVYAEFIVAHDEVEHLIADHTDDRDAYNAAVTRANSARRAVADAIDRATRTTDD